MEGRLKVLILADGDTASAAEAVILGLEDAGPGGLAPFYSRLVSHDTVVSISSVYRP